MLVFVSLLLLFYDNLIGFELDALSFFFQRTEVA